MLGYRPLRQLWHRVRPGTPEAVRAPASGPELVERVVDRVVGGDSLWVLADQPHRSGPDWAAAHHLLVGPGGVVVVDVVDHPGASVWVQHEFVKVNGTNTPYLRRCRRDTDRVAAVLAGATRFEVPVHAVVLFGQAGHFTLKHQPDQVTVLDRDELADWVRDLPFALLPTEIRAVRHVVDDPATWQGAPA